MKIEINLGEAPARVSEILIGEDLMKDLGGVLHIALGNRSAFWIWDEAVWELWGNRTAELGWPIDTIEGRIILFTASEPEKRLASVELLARRMVSAGANRNSAIIAVGGGVTGDVAAFLASIYMRGIPCFQIPTTLLAQVDSSVGGKTGVDLPEGKNLLGTFHQPQQVYIDPGFLTTLPDEELRQGMAEVIKSAMIGDEVLWKFVESNSAAIKRRDPNTLARIISASCLLKAKIVEADEKESGRRRALNLGHTVGHALEKLTGFRLKHGDCVATGMVVAAELSRRIGKLHAEDLQRLESLCETWEMPVRIPASIKAQDIVGAVRADKKRIGDKLHFIIPVRIGEVIEFTEIDQGKFVEVLKALGAG